MADAPEGTGAPEEQDRAEGAASEVSDAIVLRPATLPVRQPSIAAVLWSRLPALARNPVVVAAAAVTATVAADALARVVRRALGGDPGSTQGVTEISGTIVHHVHVVHHHVIEHVQPRVIPPAPPS